VVTRWRIHTIVQTIIKKYIVGLYTLHTHKHAQIGIFDSAKITKITL